VGNKEWDQYLTKLAEVNSDSLIDIAFSLLILREGLHHSATASLPENLQQHGHPNSVHRHLLV
jgi:hypothetical protein